MLPTHRLNGYVCNLSRERIRTC